MIAVTQKANSRAHEMAVQVPIVFTPKYRRKTIYNQYRKDLGEILRRLCMWKGVEAIEWHLMPDHFLVDINNAVPLDPCDELVVQHDAVARLAANVADRERI